MYKVALLELNQESPEDGLSGGVSETNTAFPPASPDPSPDAPVGPVAPALASNAQSSPFMSGCDPEEFPIAM